MHYFIADSEYHYTRMMLFSWECKSEPTNLSQTNGEFFIKELEQYIDITRAKTFVINCNNVMDIDDHFLDPFQDFCHKNRIDLYFYSNDNLHALCKYIDEHFDESQGVTSNYYQTGSFSIVCLSRAEQCSSSALALIKKSVDLEKNKITELVADSYSVNIKKEMLSSTPLIPSGQFNATELISEPSHFRWIVLLLVEIIHKTVQQDKPIQYTIVASSLRGAAIAGSVKELLHFLSGPDLYVIDHIGPKHDIIEKPSSHNFVHSDYCVYVGDFLIAGTELKITKAYCNFLGGSIKHAFVIGKYTQLKNLNGVKLHSLVMLSDCVKELSYQLG